MSFRLLWIAVSTFFCVWIFYLCPLPPPKRNHGNPIKGSQCESAHENKPLATWCGCLAALHLGELWEVPVESLQIFCVLGSRYAKNTNSTQMPNMPNEPMPVGSHVEAVSFVSHTHKEEIFIFSGFQRNIQIRVLSFALFPNRRTASLGHHSFMMHYYIIASAVLQCHYIWHPHFSIWTPVMSKHINRRFNRPPFKSEVSVFHVFGALCHRDRHGDP